MLLPSALRVLVPIPKGPLSGIVRSVHDGDTLRVLLFTELKCRLGGIQAPELADGARAIAARNRLTDLTNDLVVSVNVKGEYKYGGEKMVDILAGDKDVAKVLIAEGLAVAWDGRGPRPKGFVFSPEV